MFYVGYKWLIGNDITSICASLGKLHVRHNKNVTQKPQRKKAI